MTPILELKNVSAGYDHEVILHQVNLKIYEHDFLGIIGPNGGGKTTLLKVILGLLKPYNGESPDKISSAICRRTAVSTSVFPSMSPK